jgi:hypothetical protein
MTPVHGARPAIAQDVTRVRHRGDHSGHKAGPHRLPSRQDIHDCPHLASPEILPGKILRQSDNSQQFNGCCHVLPPYKT